MNEEVNGVIDIKKVVIIIESGIYLEKLSLNYLTEDQFSF